MTRGTSHSTVTDDGYDSPVADRFDAPVAVALVTTPGKVATSSPATTPTPEALAALAFSFAADPYENDDG